MIANSDLARALLPAVRKAGAAILDVKARLETGEDLAQAKSDGSPVTIADEAAEAILLKALAEIAPDIPVISEENAASHQLAPPPAFFLVDPLDGTREFLRTDCEGAYTVNIGLIENGAPTLGILHAPARERTFWGVVGEGAFEGETSIRARTMPKPGGIAFISRSHHNPSTDALLEDVGITTTHRLGSSLKFALLACGEADLYARHSPTMEWDIAAGDAILRAAGGSVEKLDGSSMTYGKVEYRNEGFVARGR
jgi:3'(2'), 5'-bisphosphate nucleotidase